MATNKRKDAAALFELIDKSTLKVPKTGGNLKIPGWWSNKTNPSNKEASARSTAVPRATAAASGGVALAEAPETVPESEPAPGAEPQTRLFEPPPVHVTPSSSPSIRPPKAALAAVVADPVKVTSSGAGPAAGGTGLKAAPSTGAGSAMPGAVDERPARVAGGAAAGGAKASPVLAPPAKDPSRKTWTPPRPASLTGVPRWAAGAVGAAVVLVIVVGTVMLFRSPHKKAQPVTPAGRVEHLYDGGTVARAKDLYYVVVYTTPAMNFKPDDSSAYKQAKYLAEHGVDVSIERVDQTVRGAGNRAESWYWVVSVKGFTSATEAKPFRDQIVKIGDQLSPGAWREAFARNGLSTAGVAGTPR